MNNTTSKGKVKAPWLVFILCWLGGSFAGMEASLFSVTLPQVIPELTQSYERAMIVQMGSYVLFAFLMGWIVGGILFGIIGDRFGRVKAMAACILLYSGFTGLAALATEPWHFVVCRFFVGVGVGGEMLSISVLLSESWPSRSRAVAVGVLITSYQLGVFLAGMVGALFSEWRVVFGIGALPLLLAIAVLTMLQEPQKWRDAQAQKVPNSSPFLKRNFAHFTTLFSPQLRRNVWVGSIAFGGMSIGYWASAAWIPTWIQDLLGADATGQEKYWATMYHATAAILGCCIAGFLVNSYGRIPTIMAAFCGAFLTSAWMFLGDTHFSSMIYVQYTVLGLFVGLIQASLYIYLPELFPTLIRATAVGFCMNISRIFTGIAVLFVSLLVPVLGGYANALMTFSCIYVMGMGILYVGNETREASVLN
jgi:MFS family permease